jgi:HSP20 family protein
MAVWPSLLLSAELGDLTDDVRRLFAELEQEGHPVAPGDCLPPLDVLETDSTIQVLMDLPGVPPTAVRVLLKSNVVVIAGGKWATSPGAASGGYHLVERGSGRFARAVRISSAIDGGRVTATLTSGELRITLPKVEERRGRGFPVAVTSSGEPRA